MWDKEKIKSILSHREPFLFIDEVIEVEEGRRIVAKKYIDPDEAFFKGHFPGSPVMPGVLTLEAMAQAGLILFYTTKPEVAKTHPDYYLAKVNAEFISPVYPGDTLILEVRNTKILSYAGMVDAQAKVGDKIVAKMSFAFAVKKREK